MDSIQVFILAAGRSSRMGKPKQLVEINGKFLLKHIIDIVLSAGFTKVSVVLGAYAEEISEKIDLNNVEILLNSDWMEGMSSSFRTAIESIRSSEINAALFILGDQALLTKKLLSFINNEYSKNDLDIITCEYGKSIGPPSLFPSSYFESLKNLKGDKGAKSIILKNLNKLTKIDFAGGNKDVDTPDDLHQFLM